MIDTIRINRTCPNRVGFTLIELVMVVMILSIVAAVAVPRYVSATARFNADAAARRVKLDLEYLQHQAKRTGSAKSVVFNLVTHSYTLTGVPDLNHPGQIYSVTLTRTPYSARLSSVTCGGDLTLSFDGFGVPDSSATIVVSDGNIQRAVAVETSSGRVTIQ